MKIKCDICGSELVMLAGGKGAACKSCGMEHSVERIREMLNISPAKSEEPKSEPTPKAKPAKKKTAPLADDIYLVEEYEVIGEELVSEESTEKEEKAKKASKKSKELTESLESDFIIKKKWGNYRLCGYKGKAQRVIFPENYIQIDQPLFAGHDEIEEIIFPKGYGNIGADELFANLKNLKRVVFGAGSCLSYRDFYNCPSLEEVVAQDSLYIIGQEIFANCPRLKNVIFEPTASFDIGRRAFKNCTSLEQIIFPKHFEAMEGSGIQSNAFENCTSLKRVVLPDNIKAIHKDAFKGCYSLKEVTTHSGGLSEVAIHPDAFSDSSFEPDAAGVCPKCNKKLSCSELGLQCSCGFMASADEEID